MLSVNQQHESQALLSKRSFRYSAKHCMSFAHLVSQMIAVSILVVPGCLRVAGWLLLLLLPVPFASQSLATHLLVRCARNQHGVTVLATLHDVVEAATGKAWCRGVVTFLLMGHCVFCSGAMCVLARMTIGDMPWSSWDGMIALVLGACTIFPLFLTRESYMMMVTLSSSVSVAIVVFGSLILGAVDAPTDAASTDPIVLGGAARALVVAAFGADVPVQHALSVWWRADNTERSLFGVTTSAAHVCASIINIVVGVVFYKIYGDNITTPITDTFTPGIGADILRGVVVFNLMIWYGHRINLAWLSIEEELVTASEAIVVVGSRRVFMCTLVRGTTLVLPALVPLMFDDKLDALVLAGFSSAFVTHVLPLAAATKMLWGESTAATRASYVLVPTTACVMFIWVIRETILGNGRHFA